ncbi:MAG: peptidoglycan-binding domain-containing protein [Gemmatimonadota bacterium]
MTNPDVSTDQHLVAAGDHLSRVAVVHRFRSFAPLWNDPGNAALRQIRHTPHILATGDVVQVPPLATQEVDRETDKRHKFKVELHRLVLRIKPRRWLDEKDDAPPSDVLLDGKPVLFIAGAEGEVEIPIEALSDRVTFKFPSRDILVRLGQLQPIDVVAGQRERLNNLGYSAGDSDDPTKLAFRSAVEELQCDQHLEVDGKCGPATQARLAKVYGC